MIKDQDAIDREIQGSLSDCSILVQSLRDVVGKFPVSDGHGLYAKIREVDTEINNLGLRVEHRQQFREINREKEEDQG